MASPRPAVAVKPGYGKNLPPALQKFMQKQNEVSEGTEGQTGTSPSSTAANANSATVNRTPSAAASIKTQPSQLGAADGIGKKPVALRPTVGATKPSETRRVSVPKAFQNDAVSSNDSPKPSVLAQKNSGPDDKPKVQAKHWAKPSPGTKPSAAANQNTPPKATSTATTPSAITKPHPVALKPPVAGVKLPVADKSPINKTDSTVSTTSTSSASSSSSSLSSTPSTSTTTTNEPGVIDFRSQLKPVNRSAGNTAPARNNITPMKPSIVPSQIKKTDSVKDSTGSPIANGSSPTSPTTKSPAAMQTSGVQLRKTSSKDTNNQELKKRDSSSVIVERKSDAKKFKKVKLEKLSISDVPPAKPALPGDLDLSQIRQQYQRTIQTLKAESDASNSNADVVEDDDEIYTDAVSAEEVLPRPSTFKRQSDRISIIPDMTAEEEEADGPLYDEGFTPASPPPVPTGDEMYVDAVTERRVVPQEGEGDSDGDIYEDEESFAQPQESEEDKRKRLKEEAEAKKREEKERKEKEKEEERRRKKEEKEKKEEMKLRKKFNLTGDEKVGEGVIKQDVKAWGGLAGLSVKKGQMVTIVRLDNNPPNKWLIKTESGMGYVDSSIIEVDPAIIKQAMVSARKESITSKEGDDTQPFYDDVPKDDSKDIEDDEEIYEECP